MQVTGMLTGSRLLAHVGFLTSEVLGPDATEDHIQALIDDLRGERAVGQYKALFAPNTAHFAMSAYLSMIFDEQTYAPNQPYAGTTKFGKHYTRLVGDLKPSGEEF